MPRAEIRDLRSPVEALNLCKFGLEQFSTDNATLSFILVFQVIIIL